MINLTSGQDDLHAVSMGLNLAKTAVEKGLPVAVFLVLTLRVIVS